MKPLLNNRQLVSALNKGEDISVIAKDLNLYQVIATDKEWETSDGIPMREKTYLVKHSTGVARWTVRMRKGEFVSVKCEHNI